MVGWLTRGDGNQNQKSNRIDLTFSLPLSNNPFRPWIFLFSYVDGWACPFAGGRRAKEGMEKRDNVVIFFRSSTSYFDITKNRPMNFLIIDLFSFSGGGDFIPLIRTFFFSFFLLLPLRFRHFITSLCIIFLLSFLSSLIIIYCHHFFSLFG